MREGGKEGGTSCGDGGGGGTVGVSVEVEEEELAVGEEGGVPLLVLVSSFSFIHFSIQLLAV